MAPLQAELRDNEAHYRALFKSMGQGFCVIERIESADGALPDFLYIEANPAFEAQTGLVAVVGRTLREVLSAEFQERSLTYHNVLQTGEPLWFERVFGAEGRVLSLYAFRVEDHTHRRVAISVQDITERKRAEHLLRQNHDTFFHLIENAPFGVYVVDAQFRLRQVSTAARKAFGDIDPLIGRDFDEVLRLVWAEPFASEALQRFHHTLQSGESYAAPNTTQQRQNISEVESYDWKIERLTLPDGQFGVVCYFYDITQQKQAEQALRDSEAFSRSIIKSSPDCIKVLDLNGNLLSIQNGQELLGIKDLQPFLNKPWLDFWTGDDWFAAQEAIQSAAAGGSGSFVGFFRTLDGEDKWWDVRLSPILDDDNQPMRLLAVSRDVTQRQQAAEVLRQRTAQFEALFNLAPLGVHLIDADFRVREVNPTALLAFGNLPDLIGRDYAEVLQILWPRAKADEATAQFRHTLETGEPCYVAELIEQRADRQNVEYYEWQINRIPLPDGRYGVVCYFRDISERVLAQQKIRQSEERYRSLFNSIEEGFAIIEIIFDDAGIPVDYCCLEANPAFETQTGIAEPKGKCIRQIVPDQALDNIEIYAQILDTGVAVRFVTESKALKRWFDVYAFKVGGPDSQKIAIVFNNITQRRLSEQALRESEERFRIFVTASSDVVYRMSPDWREMRQLDGQNFTLNTGEPSHNWLEKYLPVEDQPFVMAIINEAIRTKSLYELEHRVKRPDGSLGWIFSRAVPLLDASGEIIEWFGTASDVTERRETAQNLRQSEERYRSLFNSIDEGFCLIEVMFDDDNQALDYRFLQVNPAFAKQTGIQDATGRTMREIAPDHDAEWFEIYGKVALTGEAVRFVNQAKALGGRWFDVYATRLGEPAKRQVAILFNNITERTTAAEALRQSDERFRALFDRGPIAIYACDTTGTVLEINRSAITLLGQPQPGQSDEQFRSAFRFYLPDGTPLAHTQTWMSLVPNGAVTDAHNVEVIIERPDRSRITVIANIVALKDAGGKVTGAINCFYDITERSRLERQTLEQAQALVELDRRKDEFLAMLSHELRNPLAPLASAVQILRLQKNEDPLQQQAHNIIERQVGQLKHLVDDLLEVSRITTGSVRLRQEAVCVSVIVEQALETAQPLIVQRRHVLQVVLPAQPICLYADAARLEQVLVNLLTNAAKYTPEGGHIWLNVEQEKLAESAVVGAVDAGVVVPMVVIRVRDSGIGIAPELLSRIFDMFTQAERSIDRSEGGLGIGLCLVQRLVELHGGTVGAHSTPGQGSEFVVRLPILSSSVPALPLLTAPIALPLEKVCRVLVVDDNVDAAQSMARLLELSGYEVHLAYDGPQAIEAALALQPAVVLLDIGLPGLTGLEVAQRLRTEATLAGVVLVALTGYGQESDRQLSREAGIDHHLVKPARFADIEKILTSVLQPAAAGPPL